MTEERIAELWIENERLRQRLKEAEALFNAIRTCQPDTAESAELVQRIAVFMNSTTIIGQPPWSLSSDATPEEPAPEKPETRDAATVIAYDLYPSSARPANP